MSLQEDSNDFGDLIASGDAGGAFASPGIAGGYEPTNDNTIEFCELLPLQETHKILVI